MTGIGTKEETEELSSTTRGSPHTGQGTAQTAQTAQRSALSVSFSLCDAAFSLLASGVLADTAVVSTVKSATQPGFESESQDVFGESDDMVVASVQVFPYLYMCIGI